MDVVTQKVVPTGVRIISVLYYIGAISGILSGILFFFGGSFLGGSVPSDMSLLGLFGITSLFVIGTFWIILGILMFFIARGLTRRKNWTRVLVIIFSVLPILVSLWMIIEGSWTWLGIIINILINGFVVGYLLFSSKVKEFFSDNPLEELVFI